MESKIKFKSLRKFVKQKRIYDARKRNTQFN
jgi:hypothetical protein